VWAPSVCGPLYCRSALVVVVAFHLLSAVAAVIDCVIISLMDSRQTIIELC